MIVTVYVAIVLLIVWLIVKLFGWIVGSELKERSKVVNMVKTRFLIFYSIVCTMVLNKLFLI